MKKVEKFRKKNIKSSMASYYKKGRGICSKPELEWLEIHGVSSRQCMVRGNTGRLYSVDGRKENVLYEFLGIFWHGHPRYFDKDQLNPAKQKTFGVLFEETKERIQDLKNAGFTVIAVWEDGTDFTGIEDK